MKIKITKQLKRNTLACTREDGSYTKADLGPSLPHHDLAHFVMENFLQLKNGFYGNIEKGYSMQQPSNKEVIQTLHWEAWFAEIAARALQALSSGACSTHNFSEMINSELDSINRPEKIDIPVEMTEALKQQFIELNQRFENLIEGESLVLGFSTNKFNKKEAANISR